VTHVNRRSVRLGMTAPCWLRPCITGWSVRLPAESSAYSWCSAHVHTLSARSASQPSPWKASSGSRPVLASCRIGCGDLTATGRYGAAPVCRLRQPGEEPVSLLRTVRPPPELALATSGDQRPGHQNVPEERMPAGLVVIHGRAHGARIAAQPAEAVGARCTPPGQIPGLAAANAAAVTR
jgi:hypothetical protein